MKSGDFVYIDFIGRVKDTGEIFDLTKEDVAKKEGVYNEKSKYQPVPLVVGGGFVLKGLEDAIKEMKIGEKKTIELTPDKAFGERRVDLIRPIALALFKEKDINPTPGSYVTINGVNGRILSSDGGRVKVDFNHPLSGKKIEYEIEIKKEITDASEKVRSVVNFFCAAQMSEIEAEVKNGEAEVKINKKIDIPVSVKETIAENIMKWVSGIVSVKFVDIYKKK